MSILDKITKKKGLIAFLCLSIFSTGNKSSSTNQGWNDKLFFYVKKFDKIVFFHEEDSLPSTMSNSYMILKTDGDWNGYDVFIEKRIVSQTSLIRLPCSSNDFLTCQDVHFHSSLIKEHGCWIPMFYSGKHINDLLNTSYPPCGVNDILEVFYINCR